MSEQQRIEKVTYKRLKGLKDLTISFEGKNVTGIFGVNGCGKSTILHSLLCFYRPKNSLGKNFKFSYFFKTTLGVNWKNSEMIVDYSFRDGKDEKESTIRFRKTAERWLPHYCKRYDRDVFFVGISSCVPDIEQTRKDVSRLILRSSKNITNKEKILGASSRILGCEYCQIQTLLAENLNRNYRKVERKNPDLIYTSLAMGAGEQRVFKILDIIINAPKYSLIVIDEIDLALHTGALNRLIDYIVEEAEKKHLQVVFTSHREELTKRNDINIRHIFQTNEGTLCLENSTPECMDRLLGKSVRVLDVFVEDDLACAIIENLCRDLNLRKRVSICKFGAFDNAFVASIGLDVIGKDMSNTLFVLDGDKCRTSKEKEELMEKKYSGSEVYRKERRRKVLDIIKQFNLPENMAPEQYICETLKHSSDENEIVFSARKIVAPSDTHNYLNDIIETLGEDRKVGLDNIIKEFKKNEEVWNLYIKDIKDWFEEKKKKLDL